jgi:hypothetical protein
MVYCGSQASFAVNMSKMARVEVEAFSTPDSWEDALPILEAVG